VFSNRSSLIRTNPPLLHYGAAVCDVDGDGEYEIAIAGYGGPNRLLKFLNGGLADVGDAVFGDVGRQSLGIAAGDFDGDGREEVYILNSDSFAGPKQSGDRLFKLAESGWSDLFMESRNRTALNLTAGRSIVAVDRLGRGRYGFFVANYGGPMRMFELGEDGDVVDVAEEAGLDMISGGRCALSLPLATARMDVFVGNEGGPNFLFRNLGDGTFVNVAEAWGLADADEAARGVACFDADGDGRLDLALGNWEGPQRLFVREPKGRFRNLAPNDWAIPARNRTVIVADFDNDGREEVFFNNIGQPNRLFGWRRGTWTAIDIGDALEPGGLGTGAVVGDFDGDGRLELLICHGESGAQPLTYFHAPNVDHHWIRVAPLTPTEAPARGAIVRVKAADREQVRAIDAGSGYLCQMEPVAHFGLGKATAVDEVTIAWPDGATVSIDSPHCDQKIVVPHPMAG
jgi:hypothetical protein